MYKFFDLFGGAHSSPWNYFWKAHINSFNWQYIPNLLKNSWNSYITIYILSITCKKSIWVYKNILHVTKLIRQP